MGKKKHRHGRQMSKNELIRAMVQTKMSKKAAYQTPFAGVMTLTSWVQWQYDGWGQIRLLRYLDLVKEIDAEVDEGSLFLQDIRDNIWEIGTLDLLKPIDTRDIHYRKERNYLDKLINEQQETDSTTLEYGIRFLLIHFEALRRLGYGRKRIIRNANVVFEYLELFGQNKVSIVDLNKDLENCVGVKIDITILL